MKKLLLLILLLTSFTAQALSIDLPMPCIDKFFMKLLEDELEELTKLSNSDKDNLTYKNHIDELQVDIYELVGSICRKSPQGNLVDDKRKGVWT